MESDLLNEFWWSHYGLCPRNKTDIQIKGNDGRINYAANLVTAGYFKERLGKPEILPKHELKMESELLGRNVDDILKAESILFSRTYRPEQPTFGEFSSKFLGVEKAEILHPPFFSIFHPADYLTSHVVDEAVRRFAREYCGVSFSEVNLGEIPGFEAVRQEFEERQKRIEGYKPRDLRLGPDSLELLFGADEVARFEGKGIQYAISRVGNNNFSVVLADGSEHLIGKPKLKLVGKE